MSEKDDYKKLLAHVEQQDIQADYSKEDRQRVINFCLSVISLYGQKAKDMKDPENLRPLLRAYAQDILSFSDHVYQLRLKKVKELKQAGHDDYKWPDDALAKATGNIEVLNHDYSQFYAVGSDAKAMKSAPMIEHKPSDPEVAKKHLGNLKGMFDDK